MSRFLVFFSLIFFSCGGNQIDTEVTSSSSPNIVLVVSDDQGWGDLSLHGNTNLNTPHIDGLAASGASFDRFFVSPVCSPTRAEILTGRYHPRGGVFSTSAGGERLDLDEVTIADILKQAGYQTAAFGKWHNGMQYPYHPAGRGFDEYYGFCSGHWGNYFSPMLEHNGQLVQGDGFVIDDFTNRAIEFMEKNQEAPFFIYLPYNTPHSPMQVPDRWWNKFEDKELSMRNREPEKEDIVHTRAALAMCENIDWNVGRLLSALDSLALSEETIFIYLSDNGPNGYRWNGGMKGRKGSTDEGGVRSPLFVRWPGTIPGGKQVGEIASAIDFLPTLTDLAGISPDLPNRLDGSSLKPLLLDEDPQWEDRLIFNHWRGRTSVRSQQYRLGHDGQLFDMIKDPNQRNDLSSELTEVASTLSDARQKWEEEVLSELPEEDTRTFPLGHPDFIHTQVPARDGIPHGGIERSNRFPNNTFFRNWTSTHDSITWDVDVVADGVFSVEIYYTCPPEDVGSTFVLQSGDSKVEAKVVEAHNPPLQGMEHDRHQRQESYVKDFRPLHISDITLKKGKQQLVLKALDIPGNSVMDVRLLMFHRKS